MPPPPLEWQPEQLYCLKSCLPVVDSFRVVVIGGGARVDGDQSMIDARLEGGINNALITRGYGRDASPECEPLLQALRDTASAPAVAIVRPRCRD